MCDPTGGFLIAAGLQGAGQIVNFIQQDELAEAQNEQRRQEADLGASLAERAATRQRDAVRGRQAELREADAAEVDRINREALRNAGLVRVAAGGAGAAGASVAALFGEVTAQEARAKSSVARSSALRDLQAEREIGGIQDQLLGRLSSSRFVPVARPSFLNLALGLAGSTMGAFNANTQTVDGQTVTPFGIGDGQ